MVAFSTNVALKWSRTECSVANGQWYAVYVFLFIYTVSLLAVKLKILESVTTAFLSQPKKFSEKLGKS